MPTYPTGAIRNPQQRQRSVAHYNAQAQPGGTLQQQQQAYMTSVYGQNRGNGTYGSVGRGMWGSPNPNDPDAAPVWLGTHGTHRPGTNIDAGSRTVGDANFGAFAATDNYLQGLSRLGGQQYQQGVSYLLGNGLMPSYNGQSLDQRSGPDQYRSFRMGGNNMGGHMSAATRAAAYNGGFTPGSPKSFGGDMQGSPMRSMMQPPAQQQPGFMPGMSGAHPGFGGGFASGGFGTPPMSHPSGSLRPGGFFGGQPGTMGLPLEGQAQNSISDILRNPNPLNSQQQGLLRSQVTSNIDNEYQADLAELEYDAIRRGVNPSETAGSRRALAQGARSQRQTAQQGFEINNALQGRQQTQNALAAALGLMNTQIGNEDSIRRYYAMLGASQNGAPLFLGGL